MSRPFLALLALAALLAAILLLEYRASGERSVAPIGARAAMQAPAGRAPAAGLVTPPVTPPAGASLGSLADVILGRPLFSPSRRPGRVAAVNQALPRLAGIIIGPAGARAIFATDADQRAIIAGAGAHAGPYLIRDVRADGVAVLGPGGPEILRPAFDRNAAAGSGSGVAVSGPAMILDLLHTRLQNNRGPNGAPLPAGLPPLDLPQPDPNPQR